MAEALRKKASVEEAIAALAAVITDLQGAANLAQIPPAARGTVHKDLYLVSESLTRLAKAKRLPLPNLEPALVNHYLAEIKPLTTFIPNWVNLAVALALGLGLGLGTMTGWKRIVVTVDEEIGKAHLTYAQGAPAELVAFTTIQAADVLGLPVSTTHVLSSGIAGSLFASRSGVRASTVRNMLLAWVLTLPVCVLLEAMTFAAGLTVVFTFLGGR